MGSQVSYGIIKTFYDSMEPMGVEFYWCKLYIALSIIGIMQKRRTKFVSDIILLDQGKIVN